MLDTKTLDEVAAVGSKLKKEELLGRLSEDSLKFLRWALDPAITFGVIVDPDEEVRQRGSSLGCIQLDKRDFWRGFDKLCDLLSRRELTGNEAIASIRNLMAKAPETVDVVWSCRILNKDLRAGFSVSTLNKAHPGCIEPFSVALAKPYEPDKHEIRGAWCVEPKLDGLRMVVIGGQAFTRNGRTIESVGHILQVLEPWKDRFVFDGEIMGATEFNEDSGKIRKKGEGPNLELVYNVFDCIDVKDWTSKKTMTFKIRRENLTHALGGSGHRFVKIVESRDLKADPTSEELFAIRDYFISKGYEGAMLKNLDAPYVFKRSDNVLKLKTLETADGTITGWYEGKGRHKGRLGGFVVEFDGVETKVGGGFSDQQRAEIWAGGPKKHMLDSYMGKAVEVEYQNKTPEGALRFPVFVRFRPDKD